jgi:prolipoprotein diacylglyceryl transferase
VWGGIFLGAVVGSIIVRRAGVSARRFLDVAAPGLLLAQGIGRIGNWWNQELFGKPSKLPWALKIDDAHRPLQYLDRATYHPTFLYELIWDVVGVLVLLWVMRRFTLRPSGLFALYVAWYCFGRFFEELLRIDPAHHFAGLRLNAWVSVILFVVSVLYFLRLQGVLGGPKLPRLKRRQKTPEEEHRPAMAIPRGRVR